jgi:hypothetical protein
MSGLEREGGDGLDAEGTGATGNGWARDGRRCGREASHRCAISGAKRKYREVSIRKGYALKERSARCPSTGRALGRTLWPMRPANGR